MTMGEDQLFRSCEQFSTYPKNVLSVGTFFHNLQTLHKRLDDREDTLFCTEDAAALHLQDYEDGLEVTRFSAQTLEKLRRHLCIQVGQSRFLRPDPSARYVFITAGNSRSPLRTTRDMLMLLFTFHGVMPSFLEFVFAFGEQHSAQDFHFSGFRAENSFADYGETMHIESLRRSGRVLQMCYSLKAIELQTLGPRSQWTIRQSAVYHSFDFVQGTALWVIIKGNTLLRDRIDLHRTNSTISKKREPQTFEEALVSTLDTHLLLCDWAVENWRWYINYLEERVQEITGDVMEIAVDEIQDESVAFEPEPESSPAQPQKSRLQELLSSTSKLHRRLLGRSKVAERASDIHAEYGDASTPLQPMTSEPEVSTEGPFAFQFKELQSLQAVEEKANEASLILTANADILNQMRECYHDIILSEEKGVAPQIAQCKLRLELFESQLKRFANDLNRHASRVAALLRMIADRKALFFATLSFQSTLSNLQFARKAQISTEEMQEMTKEMHNIAVKTQQETVSMRILTLVALVFLPGTFFSGIMSTPIIDSKMTSGDATELFCYLTIPFTVFVFVVWVVFHFYTRKKDESRNVLREVTPHVKWLS